MSTACSEKDENSCFRVNDVLAHSHIAIKTTCMSGISDWKQMTTYSTFCMAFLKAPIPYFRSAKWSRWTRKLIILNDIPNFTKFYQDKNLAHASLIPLFYTRITMDLLILEISGTVWFAYEKGVLKYSLLHRLLVWPIALRTCVEMIKIYIS